MKSTRFPSSLKYSFPVLLCAALSYPQFTYADPVADTAAVATNPNGESSIESALKINGFMTVTAGRVLSGNGGGTTLISPNYRCPCFISDWYNGSVYGSDWSMTPDTRIGVQAEYAINPELSLIAQVTERAVYNVPQVQWAYAAYKIDDQWDIHIGRQRIPLYRYADVQDVTYSFPWVTTSPELYGYEVNNYNGISARYHSKLGVIGINADVFVGQEHIRDDTFTKDFIFNTNMEVQWNNMVGGEIEASHDFWTVHANYFQTNVNWDDGNPLHTRLENLKVLGLSVNLDFDRWFVILDGGNLTRYTYWNGSLINHQAYTEHNPAGTISIGAKYGNWTPVINYSTFRDGYSYSFAPSPTDTQFAVPFHGWGFTLRNDVTETSSIKLQYDRTYDGSRIPGTDTPAIASGGNSNVFRISYDRIF